MDLIQYLIERKILKKEQGIKLRGKVKKTGLSPEEVILKGKLIGEKQLFNLKSEALKIPLHETPAERISVEVLSIIPRESAEFYKMIPLALKKAKKVLEVGMVFPEDPRAQEALKFLTRQQKLTPEVFLITFSDFEKCLRSYLVPEKEMEKALGRLEEELEVEPERKAGVREFERLVEEAPVIKMVAVILRQAVEGGASDIHIEPTRENLRVRYRLDGILYTSLFLPMKVHPAIITRIKILSGLKIDETRLPQDGRFSTIIGEKKIDFRVSTFPTSLGEKVALRVLDPEEGMKPLDKLGLSEKNYKTLSETIEKPYGLILATGPTGCGKTTTLYAILRILNKTDVNIITLEDPVEYFVDGINQSQINTEINYTFARGLRHILRQSPDIIMVGEIRDAETASLAIHAALTGHLVLSTLHANNAIGVIPRLIDMRVRPFLIPPTLTLAVSQRLVRTLCPYCKRKVELKGKKKKYILDRIKNLPKEVIKDLKLKEPIFIYQPKGCKKCNFKGYLGRIGIFEMLKMTPSLAEIIVEKPTEGEILKEAKNQRMVSMEDDGILKVLKGETSLEEVMRVTEEMGI